MSSAKAPTHEQYMRRHAVAFELGISRHTLARLIARDATFPQFFAITPGIEVIARNDFFQWIKRKRMDARLRRSIDPKSTVLLPPALLRREDDP